MFTKMKIYCIVSLDTLFCGKLIIIFYFGGLALAATSSFCIAFKPAPL